MIRFGFHYFILFSVGLLTYGSVQAEEVAERIEEASFGPQLPKQSTHAHALWQEAKKEKSSSAKFQRLLSVFGEGATYSKENYNQLQTEFVYDFNATLNKINRKEPVVLQNAARTVLGDLATLIQKSPELLKNTTVPELSQESSPEILALKTLQALPTKQGAEALSAAIDTLLKSKNTDIAKLLLDEGVDFLKSLPVSSVNQDILKILIERRSALLIRKPDFNAVFPPKLLSQFDSALQGFSAETSCEISENSSYNKDESKTCRVDQNDLMYLAHLAFLNDPRRDIEGNPIHDLYRVRGFISPYDQTSLQIGDELIIPFTTITAMSGYLRFNQSTGRLHFVEMMQGNEPADLKSYYNAKNITESIQNSRRLIRSEKEQGYRSADNTDNFDVALYDSAAAFEGQQSVLYDVLQSKSQSLADERIIIGHSNSEYLHFSSGDYHFYSHPKTNESYYAFVPDGLDFSSSAFQPCKINVVTALDHLLFDQNLPNEADWSDTLSWISHDSNRLDTLLSIFLNPKFESLPDDFQRLFYVEVFSVLQKSEEDSKAPPSKLWDAVVEKCSELMKNKPSLAEQHRFSSFVLLLISSSVVSPEELQGKTLIKQFLSVLMDGRWVLYNIPDLFFATRELQKFFFEQFRDALAKDAQSEDRPRFYRNGMFLRALNLKQRHYEEGRSLVPELIKLLKQPEIEDFNDFVSEACEYISKYLKKDPALFEYFLSQMKEGIGSYTKLELILTGLHRIKGSLPAASGRIDSFISDLSVADSRVETLLIFKRVARSSSQDLDAVSSLDQKIDFNREIIDPSELNGLMYGLKYAIQNVLITLIGDDFDKKLILLRSLVTKFIALHIRYSAHEGLYSQTVVDTYHAIFSTRRDEIDGVFYDRYVEARKANDQNLASSILEQAKKLYRFLEELDSGMEGLPEIESYTLPRLSALDHPFDTWIDAYVGPTIPERPADEQTSNLQN